MRTLASVIVTEKNKISPDRAGPWLWGFEANRDASNVIRYTSDVQDVTLAGLVFTRRALSVIPPETDAGGSTISFKVSIENVDRSLTAFVEAGELQGQPCALYRMHADHLSTLSSAVIFRARIIGITGDDTNLHFSCGLYDLSGVQIPGGKYTRTRCRWKFSAPGNRNDTCAYTGGLTTCDKSEAQCIIRGVRDRIGAFLGMPV